MTRPSPKDDDRIYISEKPRHFTNLVAILPRLIRTGCKILFKGLDTPPLEEEHPPSEKPTPPSPEIQAIIDHLEDGDLPTRRAAIARSKALGSAAAPATAALLQGFFFWEIQDDDLQETVCAELRAALTSIGPLAARLVIQDSTSDEMEGEADKILLGIGSAVIPQLIAALEDEDFLDDVSIFANVAHLLGTFGPQASAALPILRKAAAIEEDHYKEIATEAIAKITAPPHPI